VSAAVLSIANAAAMRLYEIRRQRASDLSEIREDLRRLSRHGGFSAVELYDLVTCLQACLPITGDLQGARESLGNLACDLDSIVHYGPSEE